MRARARSAPARAFRVASRRAAAGQARHVRRCRGAMVGAPRRGQGACARAREIERVLAVYVLPVWKDRALVDIRRSDVVRLLDAVEDKHGARMADQVLVVVRSIMNWHAVRADGYTAPIVRGMRRVKPHERARSRILDDAEIAALWKAADQCGQFGALARLALLTGQRRRKLATLRWSDIVDDIWHVAREAPREKGTPVALELPPIALDIIAALPRKGEYVFPGIDGKPFWSFSRGKAALDAAMPPGTPVWKFHDLRRTTPQPFEQSRRAPGYRRAGAWPRATGCCSNLRPARVCRRDGRRAGAARVDGRVHCRSAAERRKHGGEAEGRPDEAVRPKLLPVPAQSDNYARKRQISSDCAARGSRLARSPDGGQPDR